MANPQIDEALATADRDSVKTDDGVLDTGVRVAGEDGAGRTTPEHLMAAAIAACFQQAVGIAASSQSVDASGATVQGRVTLQADEGGGYSSDFELVLSGLSGDDAERVLTQAKQFCPFTKALAGAGIQVRLG
ncbi:OsmC family protein [Quadrisphaera sp. DSM 44207]|uniref:OsmC family protein n=1 Tax=Quadrisphaera sp. DSM 44207 TaxID=1881057 RepID=UPI000886B5C5|nr:OsmC family protein [Quadrisphaera sp. DSM 44207]SDQ34315.1 Organic hydroperoxide reductase OsmC/OhrA [Quadrisphaera sp. DSM 44207]